MGIVENSMNEQYAQKIKTAAQNLGISESEFIRRAVDEYLAKLGLLDRRDEQ